MIKKIVKPGVRVEVVKQVVPSGAPWSGSNEPKPKTNIGVAVAIDGKK